MRRVKPALKGKTGKRDELSPRDPPVLVWQDQALREVIANHLIDQKLFPFSVVDLSRAFAATCARLGLAKFQFVLYALCPPDHSLRAPHGWINEPPITRWGGLSLYCQTSFSARLIGFLLKIDRTI